MSENNKKLHQLILRQLKRTNLNAEDITINKRKEWQDLLSRISRAYYDQEQELYLLERSLQISSKEMMELNEKLEYAQKIARLGYWIYDKEKDKLTWSKETFNLTGIDPTEGTPSLQEILHMIHEDDLPKLKFLMNRAFTKGEDYEIELRFKNKKDGNYYWHYAKGHPHVDSNTKNGGKIRYLSGIAIDITSRKQTEQREALRHQLTRILTENSSLKTATPSLLKLICESFNLVIGEFWIVDKNNNVLRKTTSWSNNKNKDIQSFIELSKDLTFFPNIGLEGKVWVDKKMHWIKDVLVDNLFLRVKLAKKANIHSGFALPIMFGEDVQAVLSFYSQNIFMPDNEMMDLLEDIDRQIGIFIEREQSQMHHVAMLSRQAGMSEVATSILHNIGNILNSANVSMSLLFEKLSVSRTDKLVKIAKIMKEHITNQDEFLTKDEKGRLIPEYLIALSTTIEKEMKSFSNEINNLNTHLNHIKNIVDIQKDISGVAGIKEKIYLNEIIDLSIQMGCSSTETKEIKIIKEYLCNEIIITDKAKILQIIINLIRNARDSVMIADVIPKLINIKVSKSNKSSHVKIAVTDNGVGISKVNLSRIFNFGFTTKQEGHGFGLHSSAISANEIGGSLHVKSDGEQKGATFILELPVLNENAKSDVKLEKIDSLNE